MQQESVIVTSAPVFPWHAFGVVLIQVQAARSKDFSRVVARVSIVFGMQCSGSSWPFPTQMVTTTIITVPSLTILFRLKLKPLVARDELWPKQPHTHEDPGKST